ncbi:hypothetical protein [Oricola sp.]|uniref:hypothetical protein n=1 Tax=Oricola sp. TaxID=1979950 RepID=UPI0025E599AD|nr:hypothetical protein [Oricola sp.]MCI5077387.1 hypothetical protein [Oricola sp.]
MVGVPKLTRESFEASHDLARTHGSSRWSLFRRLVIFQIKLFADGLRDLVLSPISFVVAGIGILVGGRNPHGAFDRLMQAGHITDNWIDLFGHHASRGDRPSLERMIDQVERALREDHARGGVTAEAEKHFRTLAEELRRRAAGSGRQGFAE